MAYQTDGTLPDSLLEQLVGLCPRKGISKKVSC
jgi:hypothetical protein